MSSENPSITGRVAQWVRPEIRALSAYHVPDAKGFIKLDAMENPYRWPQELVQEWQQLLAKAELNRYPDPAATTLKQALRQNMGVPDELDIILGNGSDELIQIMVMALSGPGRVVLAPEPSFVMYRMIASFTGMDYVGVPLAADFSLDLPAMLDAIAQRQPALVFLAYPNNPTGNLFDAEAVQQIIAASPGLVVLDEAYHAFAGHSFMDQLPRYDNLVVMRTVSKMGLAGLRLGLLAGPTTWLQEFDKLRLPYNINILTQLSVTFAFHHRAMLDQQTQQICADRERLMQTLSAMAGVTPFPSHANFILFRVPQGQARAIFDKLKNQGVLIKCMEGSSPALSDCLRVTVGTAEENAAFLQALKNSL